MGNKSLFPVVAVPPAFFGTFFRFERKYVPLRGGSPTVRAGVGASIPIGKRRSAPAGAPKGFPLAFWKPSGPRRWAGVPHRVAAAPPFAPQSARQSSRRAACRDFPRRKQGPACAEHTPGLAVSHEACRPSPAPQGREAWAQGEALLNGRTEDRCCRKWW